MQEDEDTSQTFHESHVTLMPKPDKGVTRTKDGTKTPQTTIPHECRCKSYTQNVSKSDQQRPDRSLTPGDQGSYPGTRGQSANGTRRVDKPQKERRSHTCSSKNPTPVPGRSKVGLRGRPPPRQPRLPGQGRSSFAYSPALRSASGRKASRLDPEKQECPRSRRTPPPVQKTGANLQKSYQN